MPYTINRFNGTQVTIVNDGTIDNTLDIKLIGKNYAGYGEIQNENFVFLLENFASNNPPPRPSSGQIWFDSSSNKLKFYDKQAKWRSTGGAEVSDTAPVGLSIGDFWYNTASKQLYAWDAPTSSFVLIGPQAVEGLSSTAMKSIKVKDTVGHEHAVIQALVSVYTENPLDSYSKTVYIISSDSFTLDPNINPIDGFSVINQGLTLRSNDSGFKWWGTATNSEKFGGLLPSSYLSTLNFADFSAERATFNDLGLLVGKTSTTLTVKINTVTSTPIIQSSSSKLSIQTNLTDITPFVIDTSDPNTANQGIVPTTDNRFNIGATNLKYASIFATNFYGTAAQANLVKIKNTSSYVEADTANTASTVVVRTSDRKIYATQFEGVATSAYYADLAEKYIPDTEYDVGTVLMVGGSEEVTACQLGARAVGPVSENPAYMMNAGLQNGVFVALKGRVPVKVVGTVLKGQELIAGPDGVAIVATVSAESNKVFAIALENNTDAGVKLVECLIL